MREHFVMPSIGSREVAWAERSGVRLREDTLKPLDFGDGSVNVHAANLDAPATSILRIRERIVPCRITCLLSLA
jgi:hypothetical protein